MTLRPRYSPQMRGYIPIEFPECPPFADMIDLDAYMDTVDNQESAEIRLRSLLLFLETAQGERVLRAAHRETLSFKQQQYTILFEEAEQDVQKERELISLKMPDLKRTSQVEGNQDNWLIFESVSRKYIEARDRSAVFDAIRKRAEVKLHHVESASGNVTFSRLLTEALQQLFNFQSQPQIVGTVVDIIGAFLKNPNLIRTKFLNFMIVGAAGTGKTTLAATIATCLARAGMFVGDRVVSAGRAEFVAEYEGQTVARTRNFLVSNLDAGVIFVDEAYGLTQWNDGKPEGYGTEAVTAMVEFMSKYKGLYCIIIAGYEKEMQRYFMSTNPGLARRFPYRFVMRDFTPNQLVHIFKRTLLTEQGRILPPGDGEDGGEPMESESYFTDEAWKYLHLLIAYCKSGRIQIEPEEYDRATRRTHHNIPHFYPTYPHMYQLFSNQAGSMTNLAEECVTVLMRKMPFGDATRRPRSVAVFPRHLSVAVMKQVIRQRVLNSALSASPIYMRELAFIERHI